ncbi:MAG: hypothetical protein K5798_03470 [Nitrosopumilus sp.]|uniref:hypothetical protein n=1 Tax=Nitrosopumilus sp. TaxID=2024843 RepID=UPI00242D014F|nr:hypothetical protein [Nitrosopumilus sp.]MCV0366311.1 hypothetical protein [Nitrosopumilus sp.]
MSNMNKCSMCGCDLRTNSLDSGCKMGTPCFDNYKIKKKTSGHIKCFKCGVVFFANHIPEKEDKHLCEECFNESKGLHRSQF